MYLLLSIIYYLVGGLEHFFIFPYIGNVIIPSDKLICFKMVWNHQPVSDEPTSYLLQNHGLYNPSGTMGWGQRHRCKAWPPTGWWRFSTRRAAGAVGCPEAQKLAMIHGGKSSSKPYFFGGVEPGSIPDAPWCWNMHTYIYPLKMTQL